MGNKKLKLTKIGVSNDSKFETADVNKWRKGINSPSIETIIIGTPFNDLKVGCNFALTDINIDGVEDHENFYWTSPVKSVTPIDKTTVEFETQNSKYKLEII